MVVVKVTSLRGLAVAGRQQCQLAARAVVVTYLMVRFEAETSRWNAATGSSAVVQLMMQSTMRSVKV